MKRSKETQKLPELTPGDRIFNDGLDAVDLRDKDGFIAAAFNHWLEGSQNVSNSMTAVGLIHNSLMVDLIGAVRELTSTIEMAARNQ